MVMKSLIAELKEALLTPRLCRPRTGETRLIATLARVCIELEERAEMAKHRSLDPHVEAVLESRVQEPTTDERVDLHPLNVTLDGESLPVIKLKNRPGEYSFALPPAKVGSVNTLRVSFNEDFGQEAATDANASQSGSRDLDRKAGATATPIAPPPAPGDKSGPFSDLVRHEAAVQRLMKAASSVTFKGCLATLNEFEELRSSRAALGRLYADEDRASSASSRRFF